MHRFNFTAIFIQWFLIGTPCIKNEMCVQFWNLWLKYWKNSSIDKLASIAQWQSTGLVNQGSWVQTSLEAFNFFFFFHPVLHFISFQFYYNLIFFRYIIFGDDKNEANYVNSKNTAIELETGKQVQLVCKQTADVVNSFFAHFFNFLFPRCYTRMLRIKVKNSTNTSALCNSKMNKLRLL